MTRHRALVALLISVLLFGYPVNTRSDSPEKTPPPPLASTPDGAASAQQLSASAQEVHYRLEDLPFHQAYPGGTDDATPAVSTAGSWSAMAEAQAIQPVATHFDGARFVSMPDGTPDISAGSDDSATPGSVSATAAAVVMVQDFEGTLGAGWNIYSNRADAYWHPVNCLSVESSGSHSAWPGLLAQDACAGAVVPQGLETWLVYGPFSLRGAQSAELTFYFRNQIGAPAYLAWMVSTNGNDFWGYQISGQYANSNVYNNGYNLVSLNLASAPGLGNVTGRDQVWIAFRFKSSTATPDRGPFIDLAYIIKNDHPRQVVNSENFDVRAFPNESWAAVDFDGTVNGETYWDDVACYARSGAWAMWPAAGGVNGVNPCNGDTYPPNLTTALIYGPFSLRYASRAWVDFMFRNRSESGHDKFGWLASYDGSNWYGRSTSGQQTSGPYGNGYNLYRFDLSYIPVTGGAPLDLREIFGPFDVERGHRTIMRSASGVMKPPGLSGRFRSLSLPAGSRVIVTTGPSGRSFSIPRSER